MQRDLLLYLAMADEPDIIVVYDSVTGAIAMTVIPDTAGQIPDILSRAAIDFPDGSIVQISTDLVRETSFSDALAQVAPDVVIEPIDAQDGLVSDALVRRGEQ